MPKNLKSKFAQREFDDKFQKVKETKHLLSSAELAASKRELEGLLNVIKEEERR